LQTDKRNKLWLNEMLPGELEEAIQKNPLAVIPMGSIEYHGPQNALGVDINSIEPPVEAGVKESGGILIPSVYWGGRAGHRLYPGSILVRTEVVRDLLTDIIEACRRMGFKAVLGVTGHMARGQKDAIRQVRERYEGDPSLVVEICAFTALVQMTRAGDGLGLEHGLCDHGGHNETSHMWASGESRVDASRLPPVDDEIPFWGLEGHDPHLASREYGDRIQEATRRAVASYCKALLDRARRIPDREKKPASLVIRFKSPRAKSAWQKVEKGFILLVENGIRRRIPYDPNQDEYVVDGLYDGLWAIHGWGIQSHTGTTVGASTAYREVELHAGKNEVDL